MWVIIMIMGPQGVHINRDFQNSRSTANTQDVESLLAKTNIQRILI